MSPAAAFLRALARALSTMNLYDEGHPSGEAAVDLVHERLLLLQEEDPQPRFTFLGQEIVYDDRPLRELREWKWSPRLASAGIQRLEITGPVDRGDLEVFLERVHAAVDDAAGGTAAVRPTRPTNIKYGVVEVAADEDAEGGAPDRELVTASLDYDFQEEVETVRWLHEEVEGRGKLQLLEAHAVVRSLSVAMHGDQAFLIPLLRLKRYDQYTTTHALNVATLSMALAESLDLGRDKVRNFGISGLLHDLGKVRVPEEILNKRGRLTEEERKVMESHPVEGARMILEAEEFLDLAAVVAYEHHIRMDGKGYPGLRYSRRCHQASDLVHVCDVFDALRTDRPYRDAWPRDRVLDYIMKGAGEEFHPDMADAFVRMMRRWSGQVAELDAEDAALPLGDGEGEEEEAPDAVRQAASSGADRTRSS